LSRLRRGVPAGPLCLDPLPDAVVVQARGGGRRAAARLRSPEGGRQRRRPQPHQTATTGDRAREARIGADDERLRARRPPRAAGGGRGERPRVARGPRRRGARKGRRVSSALRTVVILPIRLYQLTVSRLMPADTCKYHPTCSEYAALAIRKHGVLRGIPMSAWR